MESPTQGSRAEKSTMGPEDITLAEGRPQSSQGRRGLHGRELHRMVYVRSSFLCRKQPAACIMYRAGRNGRSDGFILWLGEKGVQSGWLRQDRLQ